MAKTPHRRRGPDREVGRARGRAGDPLRLLRGEPAREVLRRREQRVDLVPAGRRGVDEGPGHHRGAAGRRAGADRDHLPARGRAHRGRSAADPGGPDRAQRRDRGEQGRHLPRGDAVRGAGAVRVGRRGAADREHHRQRRGRDDPRPGRRHPRPRERPRRRARGQGHRRRRLRGRRDQGLREHQRHAARRRAPARRRAADPHLPQPDLPLDPAVRRRLRRGHDALDRLRADRGRASP